MQFELNSNIGAKVCALWNMVFLDYSYIVYSEEVF